MTANNRTNIAWEKHFVLSHVFAWRFNAAYRSSLSQKSVTKVFTQI